MLLTNHWTTLPFFMFIYRAFLAHSTFSRFRTIPTSATAVVFSQERILSPNVRESNTVLDSGFHAWDSGFQVLDSGFFFSGTWIPDSNR